MAKSSGSISLNENNPSFGGTATFKIQSSEVESWVELEIFQLGNPVSGQYWCYAVNYSPPLGNETVAYNGIFKLGPTALYQGGKAHAVASLVSYDKNHRRTVIATTAFDIAE